MVVLPAITSLWTRNPQEELLFRWESLDQGRGTMRGMVIPPEIISSWMLIRLVSQKLSRTIFVFAKMKIYAKFSFMGKFFSSKNYNKNFIFLRQF
jgi:hypothetical protein